MPKDFNEEELVGLSEDERAALTSDDDENDILKSIAGEDGDVADAGAEEDEDEGESEVADGKAGEADEPAEQPEAAAAPAEFQPTFTADAPDGLDERMAALDERAKVLAQRLEDGEVGMGEFAVQTHALAEERLQLKLSEEQAKWAATQNESARAQRWQWEQERFFGSKIGEVYQDPIVMAALDASIKQLAANPDNVKRPAGWFLEEADRQVRARLNLGGENSTSQKAASEKPAKPAAPVAVPKTLAGLPSAELADTGADEFAYLEKLLDKDPMAYEAALRKLSPEQEARYLGTA